MTKIKACKTSDIPPGNLHKVSVNEKEILLINIDGSFFAMEDTCAHAGASLSEGKLDGSTIICDWHGAQYDCKTGKLAKFPAKINDLMSYKVVVESEDVFVEV